MSDLEPLPDDVDALLTHERRRGGPTRDASARLATRLLALAPPPTVIATPHAGPPHPSTAWWGRAVRTSGVFAAGVLSGVAAYHSMQPAPPPSPRPAAVRELAPRTPSDAGVMTADAGPASDPEVPVVASPVVREVDPSAIDDARDLALIERARVALARGRSGEALRALAEHQRRFARRSAEEREALRVQALAADGRLVEARERAAAFLRQYPQSLFRPIVAEWVATSEGHESIP